MEERGPYDLVENKTWHFPSCYLSAFEPNLGPIDRLFNQVMWYEPDKKRNPFRFYSLLVCMKRMGIVLGQGLRKHMWEQYGHMLPQSKKSYPDAIHIEWPSWENNDAGSPCAPSAH